MVLPRTEPYASRASLGQVDHGRLLGTASSREKLRPNPPPEAARLRLLKNDWFAPTAKPWRTVRDAISGLPDPDDLETSGQALNHRLVAGARSYKGHTGSLLDEPAKTLKAGDHGVRAARTCWLTQMERSVTSHVRESARLQTFPDDYSFFGSWTESMRQLGNAVPVELGQAVARSVRDYLAGPAREGGTSLQSLDKQNLGVSVADALLVKDVGPLPPTEPFLGAGIYTIYYTGVIPATAGSPSGIETASTRHRSTLARPSRLALARVVSDWA